MIRQPPRATQCRSSAASDVYKRQDIALDLSDVPYIDSAGLGTLVSILRETRNAKKALKLVGLRQNIKRIFEMTRLDKIFDVYDTLEESAVGNKRVGGSY